MTEEVQQPVSTEQPASTEAPAEQTLEQVFESYKVEDKPAQTQQYVPQPQHQSQPQYQPQAPQMPHIPDPALDPDGFRRYEATRVAESQVLRQALQQVIGQQNAIQQAALKQAEEADIKKAVSFLKEKAPEVDEEMLEIALGHKARKEPKLLQIWNQRNQNPKAWEAALKAISNEFAGKFQVKTDPQLAENQRAMKTAQQTMATAQKEPSVDERLGKLQGAEFDRAMERIKQGMSPF